MKEQKEQAKEKKLGGKKRPQAIGQVQDFDGIALVVVLLMKKDSQSWRL